MPTGISSQIVWTTLGALNRVNDPVVGMAAVPMGPGLSKFAGMIGQTIVLGPDDVVFDSAIGTLYGAWYQYVQFSSTPAAYNRGQVVFWDLTVAEDKYQVTNVEAGTGAQMVAGIVINPTAGKFKLTPGNFGYIVTGGKVAVQFRAVLTGTPAIGVAVYAAAAGAGADNATADVLNSAGATTFDNVAKMQDRFLGWAETSPVGGAISNVWLGFPRRRF